MRLIWRNEGTTVLSGPVFSGAVFRIGSPIDVSVYAQNGNPYATLFSGAFVAPYSLFFINGWGVVPPSTLFTSGTVPAGDVATTSVTIPNNPGLVGQRIAFQSVVLSGAQLHWTNGTDAIIN